MTANILTRYGFSESINDPNDQWIINGLLEELRTEKFDEPDDEHTQVSVGSEHWAVTAQVSGLVTFDNIDILEGDASDLPEEMFMRDVPDDELISIWQAIVKNDIDSLLNHNWIRSFEELPAYKKDYYRV